MKKLILFILVISLVPYAYAAKVMSLYEVSVPVSSQAEQQRDQAIQHAFVHVLTKISGDENILKNPVIKDSLPEAKNLVEEFGYVSSGTPPTTLLNVQFDPRAIKQLLKQAKAVVWDENRPLILVWLAVANPGQAFEIVENSSNNEFASLLKKDADQRGLPFILPMMDISDLNKITATDIRMMSADLLQKAAERYHSDGILIGSIEYNDKVAQTHWKLILGQDQWEWSFASSEPSILVGSLIDKVTTTLRDHYTAEPSTPSQAVSSSFTLVVKGVSEHHDFEMLMRFLKQISLIKQVELENILGDEVVLHLSVQGTQKTFMQDVIVGQHLKLELENENELTYMWMR